MNKLLCIREKLTVVIFSFLKCLRFSSPFESWILKIQILSPLLFFKNVEVLILVNYLHVVTHRCGGEGPVNFSINYRLCYQRILLLTYTSPFFFFISQLRIEMSILFTGNVFESISVCLKVWHAWTIYTNSFWVSLHIRGHFIT